MKIKYKFSSPPVVVQPQNVVLTVNTALIDCSTLRIFFWQMQPEHAKISSKKKFAKFLKKYKFRPKTIPIKVKIFVKSLE